MTAERGHADGTVGKALSVLDDVAAFGRPVRFSEIMATSRWPKATLYRLLQTLTRQQMLSHDVETGFYTLGTRLIRLGHGAWLQASLAPLARPHIDALAARIGETVHLAQLDHGQVLYLDKRNPQRPVEMFSAAGKVGPAYCTGVGKAMLAFLPEASLEDAIRRQAFYGHTPATITSAAALRDALSEIRRTGISFDREEHEPSIICVAVPILSAEGRPLGALSITSTRMRLSLEALARFAPELQETARAIAADSQPWVAPVIPTSDPVHRSENKKEAIGHGR